MSKVKIEVQRDLCKSCGLCIYSCKKGVLAMVSDELNSKGYSPVDVAFPEKCSGCGNCALMCPDSAIVITRNQ